MNRFPLKGLMIGAAGLLVMAPAALAGGASMPQALMVRHVTAYVDPIQFTVGEPACIGTDFTLTAKGEVTDVRLATAFPSLHPLERSQAVDAARIAIGQQTLRPRTVDGSPVVAHHVARVVVFAHTISQPLSGSGDAVAATEKWICHQPVFAIRPIRIVASATPGMAPVEAPANTVRYVAAVGDGARYLAGFEKPVRVGAQFCVDPQGRMANAVLSDASGRAQRAAMVALDALSFTPRIINGRAVWTCGLNTAVRILAEPGAGGELAQIEPATFSTLSVGSATPNPLSQSVSSVKVSVPSDAVIPNSVQLEAQFCIEPDGSTSNRRILRSSAPQALAKAALDIAASWRFARREHTLCNAYHTVHLRVSRSSAPSDQQVKLRSTVAVN